MKMTAFFISLVTTFCLVLTSAHAEPKNEYQRIESDFAILQNRLNGLNAKDKKSQTTPQQVNVALVSLSKKIKSYTLKNVDRAYIEVALEGLTQCLKNLQAKNIKTKEAANKSLQHWQRYLTNYPILKILAADSKIFLGNDRLLSEKYTVAEDFYIDAQNTLDTLAKQIKDKNISSQFSGISEQLEALLIYTRREEPPAKTLVSKTSKTIAKKFATAHQNALKASSK